jgi:hypothetical protein
LENFSDVAHGVFNRAREVKHKDLISFRRGATLPPLFR